MNATRGLNQPPVHFFSHKSGFGAMRPPMAAVAAQLASPKTLAKKAPTAPIDIYR